jgi:hypothetical protein
MEKQTKILIGVGAVIAAYLILKPKKAVARSLGLVRCGDGTMQKKEDCATRGGYNTGAAPPINEWASLPKGPCFCITAPCNC